MLVNHGGTATQPRAPGHGRPLATTAGVLFHDRLSAALLAPGADSPPATAAGAPSQHRPSAAHLAPGHERPRAALRAARPGRPSAAPRAPGADVPCATSAQAPGQHRLRAMANATVALPAGQYRLRQEGLPHTPANPRTLTHSSAHQDTIHAHPRYRRTTRYTQSIPRPASDRRVDSPSLKGRGRGLGPNHTTHQAHPASQVPPYPRPCSTACTGFPLNHPSRAPPPKTYPRPCFHPSPLGGEGPGVRPNAPRPPSSPSLEGGGQGVGPPITPSLSLGDGEGVGG